MFSHPRDICTLNNTQVHKNDYTHTEKHFSDRKTKTTPGHQNVLNPQYKCTAEYYEIYQTLDWKRNGGIHYGNYKLHSLDPYFCWQRERETQFAVVCMEGIFFILNSERKLTNRSPASLGLGKRAVSQQELRTMEGRRKWGETGPGSVGEGTRERERERELIKYYLRGLQKGHLVPSAELSLS